MTQGAESSAAAGAGGGVTGGAPRPVGGRAAPAQSCPVDVVIPVCNGAPYILRALSSVLAQDPPPRSVIVVDDGSTDDTALLVRGVETSVPVRYLYKENGGLSSARNAGIRLSSSEYVAFLDADDEWRPGKLSRQLALFRSSGAENLGAVYCGYQVIDAESRPKPDDFVIEPAPENRGHIFERLLAANCISASGSGIVVKRECLERVGLFDEGLKAYEDWDMWLRIAAHYRFDFVPDRLVQIRKHGDNMQRRADFMFANALVFYDKWSEAARESGYAEAWGKSITSKILWDLPDLRSFHLARKLLTGKGKQNLFNGSFGSLPRFLLGHAGAITIIAAKRLLRWKLPQR